MNFENLKKEINFTGELDTTDKTRAQYSRDASLFEITPTAVAYPKDALDISRLVKWVSDHKGRHPELSITPRAAGTDMSGGAVNDSIILNTTEHFNKIFEVKDNYVLCEPGVYYRDLEKETLKHGLLFPSYPASRDRCCIGGIVNNNSGGEKTLSYGKTEKYVEELEVVLSNGEVITVKPLTRRELEEKFKLTTFEGEVYRKLATLIESNSKIIKTSTPQVTKNSAGYNLWDIWNGTTFNMVKLFVGAQGTLGITTKIKLKLIKPKEHSTMLVMFLNETSSLGEIINSVLKFKPESFESFDDHTFKLGLKFAPSIIKRMKGSLISLMFKFLPEAWMFLTGGMPKLILLAEFTADTESEALRQATNCKEEIKNTYQLNCHITQSKEETEKYWIIRRESFALLREKIKNLHTAPFIDDITVPAHTLPEFLPALDNILSKYPKLIYTVAGHMGDANFHIIPLMDLADEEQIAVIPKIMDEVYALVIKLHGSITAEHNDGLIRGFYLEQMFGQQMFVLFKEVKKIFDPLNILNPHKKTDANKEYSMSHIEKY